MIPTDRELRAAFEQQKGTQKRPETVSFKQVVIPPTPNTAAKERALTQADSILVELRNGADFDTAAKRFSMDPASKDQGGSLGWFRRGQMETKFEDVAFSLRPGTISPPVETPYGYHLIQVERIQPAEVSARHILIMPEITQADRDSAAALATRVAAMLEAGAPTSIRSSAAFADPLEEKDVRDLPADKLLPAYTAAFKDIPAGGYTPVFKLESPGRSAAFEVRRGADHRPAGRRGVQVRGREGQVEGTARGSDGDSAVPGSASRGIVCGCERAVRGESIADCRMPNAEIRGGA